MGSNVATTSTVESPNVVLERGESLQPSPAPEGAGRESETGPLARADPTTAGHEDGLAPPRTRRRRGTPAPGCLPRDDAGALGAHRLAQGLAGLE